MKPYQKSRYCIPSVARHHLCDGKIHYMISGTEKKCNCLCHKEKEEVEKII